MSLSPSAQSVAAPEPRNWSEAQIGSAAEQIAKKLGFKPGDDIKKFAEEVVGGTVKVDDWRNPAPTGMIEVRAPGDFTIWLSPYTAPARNTFTIAHELGHYYLHSNAGEKEIAVKREGNNRVEWEANCFAASFLLPAEMFTRKWHECKGDTALLAATFGVSTSVVSIRAERLNLPG